MCPALLLTICSFIGATKLAKGLVAGMLAVCSVCARVCRLCALFASNDNCTIHHQLADQPLA